MPDQVALVQRAHRRKEAHALAGLELQALAPHAVLGDAVDRAHRAPPALSPFPAAAL